jgi:hypothetical protein
MAITEKFHFQELDERSREYLLTVRDTGGRGMPGIFVSKINFLPVLGCIFGLAIIITFAIISYNQLTSEPLAVAMLETVGLLLGGWMVLAAFRVWTASKSSRYAGHFVYADAETLWECSGEYVTATDIYDLTEARGVQNYNQGKYQNTAVTVRTASGSRTFTLANESRAERLIVFLNAVAWLRAGGDNTRHVDAKSQEEINFKKLPAAVMGGVAKEMAKSGDMPRTFTARALDLDVDDVPVPKKEGRASSGLVNCLIIIAVAVVSIFLFRALNVGWRDDAIWENIKDIQNQDHRPVWLRMYLKDERNTKHRDDAKHMLVDIYKSNIARMRNGGGGVPIVGAAPNPGVPPFQMPPIGVPQFQQARIPDKDLIDGLEPILMRMAEDASTPLIKVSVKETGGGAGAEEREKSIADKYTEALFDGIGEGLVIVVGPADPPAHIELAYELNPDQKTLVRFTIKYRKTPNEEPVATVTKDMQCADHSTAALGNAAKDLGIRTVGSKKPPAPSQPAGDF